MQLMVLSHNKNIDNNKATLQDFKNKLAEETKEVLDSTNSIDAAGEVMDVIQVCIGILYKLSSEIDIRESIRRHNKKLVKRGWKASKMIVFKIYNWFE